MTESEDPIAEARRLLAALDGEWEYKKGRDNWDIHSTKKRGSAWVAEVFDERDAALIAAAPRLLAALCDRLEAAEARVEELLLYRTWIAGHEGACPLGVKLADVDDIALDYRKAMNRHKASE